MLGRKTQSLAVNILSQRIRLLGGYALNAENGAPLNLPTKKSWALLAYLVQSRGREIPREELATLLWPRSAEDQARASLRQELAVLRKGINKAEIPGVTAGKETVRFANPIASADTVAFESLVGSGTLLAFRESAVLYTGDFLSGFIVHAEPFEDWLWLERQRLKDLAINALLRLLGNDEAEADPKQAMATAQSLLGVEPTHEDGHRAMMRQLFRIGRRAEALQQYERCRLVLKRDLDTRPSSETTQLADYIRRNSSANPNAALIGRNGIGPSEAALAPRHCTLAILRAGLCPSPGSAPLEPDLLALAQDQLGARATQILAGYGGRIVDNGAERILAAFGDPTGGRNVCVEAVLAAQTLIAEPLTLANGQQVPLSAGLAYGDVLVWEKADGSYGRVVGSAVQAASRLEFIARGRELIVSADIRERLPDDIETSPVPGARHGPDGITDAGFSVRARTGLSAPRNVPFRHREVPARAGNHADAARRDE